MAMKMTTQARYALRLMLEVAKETKDAHHVDLGTISEATDISRRYLEQLVILLKNASLIRGVSGRSGGYMLGRPAAKILVGHIVEATIGPISVVDCVQEPEICEKSSECAAHLMWSTVNQAIKNILFDYTLEDLINKEGLGRLTNQLMALKNEKLSTCV